MACSSLPRTKSTHIHLVIDEKGFLSIPFYINAPPCKKEKRKRNETKRKATLQEGRETPSARPKQQEALVDPDGLPFNVERLKDLIENRFNNPNRVLSKVPPMVNLVYDIEENFVPEDRPWFKDLLRPRFSQGQSSRVLYRPNSVIGLLNKLDEVLNDRIKGGIMVKGPQEIGKSFSLVNLVLQVMSTGKYLVTFISDCNNWKDTSYFYDMICASLRIDDKQLALQINNELAYKESHQRFDDLDHPASFSTEEIQALYKGTI